MFEGESVLDCAFKQGRKYKMDPRPEITHYQVTAGIIFFGDRILISRRKDDGPLGGLWEFPGGKLEEGETLEQCLAREVREELDIDVEVMAHYMSVNHSYRGFSITLHVFICRYRSGEPRPVEVSEFRLVALNELNEYCFPPADREVLKRIATNPPEQSGSLYSS